MNSVRNIEKTLIQRHKDSALKNSLIGYLKLITCSFQLSKSSRISLLSEQNKFATLWCLGVATPLLKSSSIVNWSLMLFGMLYTDNQLRGYVKNKINLTFNSQW